MVRLDRIKNRLAYKLILSILFFSGFITLIIAALQLFIEYRRDIRSLDVQFAQIERSFLKPLSSALWRYNEELIRIQLEGICQLGDIMYVAVQDGRNTVAAFGTRPDNRQITKTFPLTYVYKNRTRNLGKLVASATLAGVYARLYDRMLIILASSAVKTFLTSFFMLLLFQLMVMRHLKEIADYFRSYTLNGAVPPLRLDIRKSGPDNGDELCQIESEINRLTDSIRCSYDLSQEALVRRTHELETANAALKKEISDRKAATDLLRVSEKKFRTIFNSAPIGMALVNAQRQPVMSNRVIQEMMGYTEEELRQMTFRDFTHPDDIAAEGDLYDDLFNSTISHYSLEKRNIRKDGETIWVSLCVAAIQQNEPSPCLAVAMVQDITEMKNKEAELRRSNRELEQFAYVASHDLQEPLRAIVGFLQLLESRCGDKLDEKGLHYIERTVKAGHRMQNLITDLLTLSRVNTRGASFEMADFNLILEAALENLQPVITEKNAKIARSELPSLAVDANQIQRLFQNLIHNALKYNKSSEPVVEIGFREQGNGVCFYVKDNGIGISPEFYERIFLIFQRLHTRREYPGTGLGLALCKKIVERHGGTIRVESRPGKGSTFCFTLLPKRCIL